MSKLLRGVEEAGYLLGRGYAPASVVDVVGRRHQLEARQRLALQRSMCSEEQRRERHEKLVSPHVLGGSELHVDGFNLVIGLEVALSRGLLLRGVDGALRDLAGLRGSYRPVEETERALELIADVQRELGVGRLRFFLDAPVSNSGRLRARILDHAARSGLPVEVALVPNADAELGGCERVVSGDSAVIDSAASWVNLLAFMVERYVAEAWLVELGKPTSSAAQG
jgi:hypothetical protein